MNVLEINGLTKKYGRITAVNQLNLSIPKGSVFGLLGPNGSGKTTTLGMILDIIIPDKGSYKWFDGIPNKHARKNMGVLLETPNFYPYMTAEQNLDIVAHIKRVKNYDLNGLLELVNLNHRRDAKFSTYSLGMKQRLAIAGAMVGDPDVLIFDEPTNGLDPQGIAEIRETIQSIANRGKTIIMASHILDEVEKICSHVAIIKNGNLLTVGTVGNIIDDNKTLEIAAPDLKALRHVLEGVKGIKELNYDDHKFILSVENDLSPADLNQLAFNNGITLTHLVLKSKSLEQEFLEITK